MLRWALVAVVSMMIVACGGVPTMSAPADGQTYSLKDPGFAGFNVTLQDNNYAATQITWYADSKLTGIITCTGGDRTYLQCYRAPMQNGGGFVDPSACQQSKCLLDIVASRGTTQSVIHVYFTP